MSDRTRIAGYAALLVTGAAGGLRGQTVAEFRQRFETLSRATHRIDVTIAAMNRTKLDQVSMDTVRAGALLVFAGASVAQRAQGGADSAWRMLVRLVGNRAQAVTYRPVVLQVADQAEGDLPAVALGASPVAVPKRASVEEIANGIFTVISPAVYDDVDVELSRWVPQLYSHSILNLAPTPLNVELSTSPWQAVRQCFNGRLNDCRQALGITGADPLTEWFDAVDRRHYVDLYLSGSASLPDYTRCVRGGVDAACLTLMQRSPSGPPLPPLSVMARQFLLALAIDAGGPAAFDRLLATRGQPLDVRLATAAGLPADSLVRRWRSRIFAARPKTVAADDRAAWAAVVWGVLFSFAALRSTRWR